MRPLALEHGVEHAHDGRVSERPKRCGLAFDPAEHALRAHELGPDDLRDDESVELVVPREVRLVAPPSAEESGRVAAGDDLVALTERPGRVLPHPRLLEALPQDPI